MKLTSVKNKLSQLASFDSIFKARFDYEIKSGAACLEYTGPKIDRAVWNDVLAFFRHTHKAHNAEAQVRLYVSASGWRAWAFPQEMQGGLAAKELDTENARQQREQFKDHLYFGTVHHHCNASAFQSGTDRANEENQDGLHLTIGNIDQGHYDLHSRFYLSGNCFEPDLSLFWGIDPRIAALLPRDCHSRIAAHAMGIPAPDGWPVPADWLANVIVKEREPIRLSGHVHGYGNGSVTTYTPWRNEYKPRVQRLAEAASLFDLHDPRGEVLDELIQSEAFVKIMEIGKEFDLRADELIEELMECEMRLTTGKPSTPDKSGTPQASGKPSPDQSDDCFPGYCEGGSWQ